MIVLKKTTDICLLLWYTVTNDCEQARERCPIIHLLINPVAGHGYAKRVATQVIRALRGKDIPFDLHYTEYPGHAQLIAQHAADSGADTLIAVGGDGTIFETAQGMLHTKTSLGIIPAGTGNDFSKSLDIPRKPLSALEHLLTHDARSVDAGLVNDKMFINVCGTGFDVMVLEYTELSKRYVRGILAYLYGILRAIRKYAPVTLEITREDGTSETKSVTIFSIANGRLFGGGIVIAPHADLQDGLLDVMTIGAKSTRQIVACLPKLLTGRVLQISDTETHRCREITVTAPQMHLNVDGEILKMDRAHFRVLPNALWVRA